MSLSSGDILRVVATLLWTDGNIMQNVFAALLSGAGGPWDEADVLDDLDAWMVDAFANIIANVSNAVDGSDITGYVWDTVGLDFDEIGLEVWSYNPTSVGEQLPRGVSALVSAPTTDPDVTGRKYIGGLTENEVTDGLWTGAFITSLFAWGSDWITQFVGATSGATITPGVWSVKNSAFFPFKGDVATTVIPAYQRRRKRGVGI